MNRTAGFHAGLMIRSLRIFSGLVLLAFVTCHLANLSFGVISLSAMDAMRPYLTGIWSNPVTGMLLMASIIVHFALGLWAIYRRPTLRTGAQDLIQLVTGILVVPLLATHAITIASLKMNGISVGYSQAIPFFWVGRPTAGLLQVILLSVVWIHGAAGLFTWLRSKADMRHALTWIYPLALAVPVLALLGYAEAGRAVLLEAQVPQVASPEPAPSAAPVRVTPEMMQNTIASIIWGSLALTGLTFAVRFLRQSVQKTRHVHLQSGDTGPLMSRSDLTVLDGLRRNDHPHANLCQGRGRCGTCAVRVRDSEFPLPPPSAMERKTLDRIKAQPDVRLACQVTPEAGFLHFEPLYPADYSFNDEDDEPLSPQGSDQGTEALS